MKFKYWFRKGVDIRYPNRWYMSAHPETMVVQYWDIETVTAMSDELKRLGFKPNKKFRTYKTPKNWPNAKELNKIEKSRNLSITFKNKSDEAYFSIIAASGIEI